MKNKFKILLLLIAGIGFFSQAIYGEKNTLVLYTDRDYCVSGDTVWFKVLLPKPFDADGNIVRVQLVSKGSNLVASVIKRSAGKFAEGYLPVPDSLSTGLCFVTAFLNAQRNSPQLETMSQTLFVYNRFEESVSEIEVPSVVEKLTVKNMGNQVKVTTGKTSFSAREKVAFRVEGDLNQIENALVKATLIDPLSYKFGGKFLKQFKSSVSEIPVFAENDGCIISGKVNDAAGNPKNNVLVLLSIPGEPPYFDYCITNNSGYFNFFLKNAKGKAHIVLQPVEKTQTRYSIILEKNHLQVETNPGTEKKILTVEESGFIENVLQGNYFKKIFHQQLTFTEADFEMPSVFAEPFYGQPTKTVFPDEFIDLPDFQEISRELLPGVQYRVKDEEVVFRMLNLQKGTFFEDDPLRLVNGIPVFKNNILSSLKSSDIKYIHIVQSERLFGDLVFKGVLAVSLYDQSGSWMLQQPNIFRFVVDCLQYDQRKNYDGDLQKNTSFPDTRHVFLWEKLQGKSETDFSFYLSDYKGKVELSVEGVTREGELFKSSQIINVQ